MAAYPQGLTSYVSRVRYYFKCAVCMAPGGKWEGHHIRWSWVEEFGLTEDGKLLCTVCADRLKRPRHRYCRRCLEPRPVSKFPAPYDTPDTDWVLGHTVFGSHICDTCRNPPRPTAECEHCTETFTQARSDARFCSTRCRVAAHRAARSERQ
jgi:hypothetical protein